LISEIRENEVCMMDSKLVFVLGFFTGVIVAVVCAVAYCAFFCSPPEMFLLSADVDIGSACYDTDPPLKGQILEGSVYEVHQSKGPVWYISFPKRVPYSFLETHAEPYSWSDD
jgi:hypothetical protein